ncbi:MAG: trypsin-like peptidase domain-containing protein [Verrucomicrobiota bacterium]
MSLLHQLDEGFVEVFNKVAPAVVVIDTTGKAAASNEPKESDSEAFDFFFRSPDPDSHKQFRMPEPPAKSEGSGFIIRADGYIATNQHVVDGAAKISVKLKDGRTFPAKLIGGDERTDIAVIKIDAANLPVAELGNSDAVRTGQIVCAIGVPFEQDYSFAMGCVSGKGRSKLTSTVTYEDYIQTDALINPGNSGGPLFDVDGRVVGMVALINKYQRGLAFAIPSNMLKSVSEQMIATGKVVRPWLGIRIDTLGEDSALRDQFQGIDKGVIVTTIEADSPVAKSDLRPADVITEVDGTPVTTARELQKIVLTKKIGESLTLTVWRNGKTLKVPVSTGELPSPEGPRLTTERNTPGKPGESLQGLQIKDLEGSPGGKPSRGVVVVTVQPDSPAAITGIQPGDVITEIDSKPVTDSATARKLLANPDGKAKMLLFLERKGKKTFEVLKIDK